MLQSVQSFSHAWLFATPWTAACQASLSITNSQSLLKLTSIESVMISNHLILCRPLLPSPSLFPYTTLFRSVTQSCPTLCDPMDCGMPGFPVYHQLPELTQTHVHWVGDTIQPSRPRLPPSLPAFNLTQHQGLFKWVRSPHQVAKVLELQFQHQSCQWIFRIDFLWIDRFVLAVQGTLKTLL